MWTCEHCGETVDEDDFEVCWRCSTPRGRLDTDEPVGPVVEDAYDDDKIAVLLAITRGIHTVVARPIILVAAAPLVAWHLFETLSGSPLVAFGVQPTRLSWSVVAATLPESVLAATSHGLAILLVCAATQGAVSVVAAGSAVVRRLPALLAVSAVYLAVSVAMVSWIPVVATMVLFWVLLYVGVRLGFWTTAILIDRLGVIAALRRSWELTRGNWWRMLAVSVVLGIATWPLRLLPHPAETLVGLLLAPVGDAILTSAYLQRVGVLPAPRPSPSPLARHGAVTFPV